MSVRGVESRRYGSHEFPRGFARTRVPAPIVPVVVVSRVCVVFALIYSVEVCVGCVLCVQLVLIKSLASLCVVKFVAGSFW